jgi:hypothetical protein
MNLSTKFKIFWMGLANEEQINFMVRPAFVNIGYLHQVSIAPVHCGVPPLSTKPNFYQLASYSFSTKETWRNLIPFMSTIEKGNRSLEERLVDGDSAHEAYHQRDSSGPTGLRASLDLKIAQESSYMAY